MAEFIETSSIVEGGQTTPTDAGTLIRNAQWGIDTTVDGYIIQNVQTSHERIYDETQDQKGALVSELDYDEQWTVTMELIGGDGNEEGIVPGLTVGDTKFVWGDHYWKVRRCDFQGTYNDKKRYTLEIFRSKNFPAGTPT